MEAQDAGGGGVGARVQCGINVVEGERDLHSL